MKLFILILILLQILTFSHQTGEDVAHLRRSRNRNRNRNKNRKKNTNKNKGKTWNFKLPKLKSKPSGEDENVAGGDPNNADGVPYSNVNIQPNVNPDPNPDVNSNGTSSEQPRETTHVPKPFGSPIKGGSYRF